MSAPSPSQATLERAVPLLAAVAAGDSEHSGFNSDASTTELSDADSKSAERNSRIPFSCVADTVSKSGCGEVVYQLPAFLIKPKSVRRDDELTSNDSNQNNMAEGTGASPFELPESFPLGPREDRPSGLNVFHACNHCNASKTACSDCRPCPRCVRLGFECSSSRDELRKVSKRSLGPIPFSRTSTLHAEPLVCHTLQSLILTSSYVRSGPASAAMLERWPACTPTAALRNASVASVLPYK